MTRKLRKPEELSRATWYLARGYQPTTIAKLIGVNRNTVLKWAKELGYQVETDASGVETRSVNAILRRFLALNPTSQKWLKSRLAA